MKSKNIISYDFVKNMPKEDLRIRSKRFLNMLDLLEKEILSHSLYNFSITINCSHVKDKKVSLSEAWENVLPQIFKNLDLFIYDSNCVSYLISSVEIHKNGFKFEKGINKKIKVEIKNTLLGYPHIHIVCGFVYNLMCTKKKIVFFTPWKPIY